jgi:hypothetical protein
MDDLPEIKEVQRLHLKPGDALVVMVDRPTMADVEHIKGRVRATLGMPDLPVLVVPTGTEVGVVTFS